MMLYGSDQEGFEIYLGWAYLGEIQLFGKVWEGVGLVGQK